MINDQTCDTFDLNERPSTTLLYLLRISSTMPRYRRIGRSINASPIARIRSARILIAVPLLLSVLLTILLLVHVDHVSHQEPVRVLDSFSSSFHQKSLLHTTSCVITVAAWRHYGHVRTLHESVQLNNPNTPCFVWFVSDTPYHNNHRGDIDIINRIKMHVTGRFDLITVDTFAHTTSNDQLLSNFFSTSHLTEEQAIAYLIPVALHYAAQHFHVDSIIYIDKQLWVNNTLMHVQKKLNTQLITLSRSQCQGPNAIRYISLLAISRKACIQHVNTHGLFSLDKSRESQDDEWEVLYDRKKYTLFFSKKASTRPVLLINYNSVKQGTQTTHYSKRLVAYNASYYGQVTFGFNYFSDGTRIEPWMRTIYNTMMAPVQEHQDGTLIMKKRDNIYNRIDFQKRVHKNPFLAKWPKNYDSGGNMTFMDWLLRGPSSQAVDMEGKFYYSEIEDFLWKSQTMNHSIRQRIWNPLGNDFHLFKLWFHGWIPHDDCNRTLFRALGGSTKISNDLYHLVQSKYIYHQVNHQFFHRNASSQLDIGVNVIGWHGGLFGVGKTAGKMYQAAVSVGIEANAIELEPVIYHAFIHPRLLPYTLSRSCSKQVNLVMTNADSTLETKGNIPEIIWRNKYNIGFWEWELDVFPEDFMRMMQHYDEIWAPSQFISNSIISSKGYDGTPVRVLPLPLTNEVGPDIEGMDIDQNPLEKTAGRLQSLFKQLHDAFVFLVIFDFSSKKQRKNPDAAIRAFLDAFASESPRRSHLIIKSHHANLWDMIEIRAVARYDARIHFIFDVLSDDEHRALQQRADCYVSLHRSEGYGMNILEEMAQGTPVIATNYSGNVDFFPPHDKLFGTCIFPIPYQLVTLTKSYGPYRKGNRWADPDHDSAVRAMQEVVKNNCKRNYGKEISQVTFANFGKEAVGKKMRDMLNASWEKIRDKDERTSIQFEVSRKVACLA